MEIAGLLDRNRQRPTRAAEHSGGEVPQARPRHLSGAVGACLRRRQHRCRMDGVVNLPRSLCPGDRSRWTPSLYQRDSSQCRLGRGGDSRFGCGHSRPALPGSPLVPPLGARLKLRHDPHSAVRRRMYAATLGRRQMASVHTLPRFLFSNLGLGEPTMSLISTALLNVQLG